MITTNSPEYKKIAKMLKVDQDIMCMTAEAQGMFAAVGLHMMSKGKEVRARVVNCWEKETSLSAMLKKAEPALVPVRKKK